MKKWLTVACLLMAVGLPGAQGAEWETNYNKALEKAKIDGRYLLLNFSGSDWCGWCIRLEKEVFSKKAFKRYAEEKLELVLLDFPRKKQGKKEKAHNIALAQKYGVQAFPTVLLLSPDEKPVARTGYRRGGPKPYVKHLEEMIKASEAKHGALQKRAPKPAS